MSACYFSMNFGDSRSRSVTEQPFKIPYYAALLRLLHDRPATEGASTSLGRQILEDFWKGFQAFLDKQAWRETRLCVSTDFWVHHVVKSAW